MHNSGLSLGVHAVISDLNFPYDQQLGLNKRKKYLPMETYLDNLDKSHCLRGLPTSRAGLVIFLRVKCMFLLLVVWVCAEV